MTFSDDYATVEAMIIEGGSFVSALGRAWRLADPENMARLQAAFPEYWATYRRIAAQRARAKAQGGM